jgi:hypothetical protein
MSSMTAYSVKIDGLSVPPGGGDNDARGGGHNAKKGEREVWDHNARGGETMMQKGGPQCKEGGGGEPTM